MAVIVNAKGTSESVFAIGKQGPKLKNNAGVIEIRNASDSAFAELKALTGTTDDGLATKAYVDSVATGLDFKDSVHIGTTANLASAYNNGTAGLGATLTSTGTGVISNIDGEPLHINDRILVKDQTDATENGIYEITDLGSGGEYIEVEAVADSSGSLNNKYWEFVDGTSTTTAAFYVWYNVNSAGTDPVGTGTGIEVAVATNATAATIAADTATAITGSAAAVTATYDSDDTLHILNTGNFNVTPNAADVDAGFTITILVEGTATPTAWVLTRTADADNSPSNEVSGGMFCFIEHGATLAATGWVLSEPVGAATLGTDGLVFTQFSSSAGFTAGDGLLKTGSVLDVVGTASRISVSADAIDIDSGYVGQSSITTLGTIAGFTSTGIDDNASATRLTLSDTANTLTAANSTSAAGGTIDITGGNGFDFFAGGGVTLTGGVGGTSNPGGAITLQAGTGGNTNGSGGIVSITSGDGPNDGGAINITSGASDSGGGDGGAINITSGNGGFTVGDPGAINITAGDAGNFLSSNNGAAVTITSGSGGAGSGAGGNILLVPGIAGTGGSAADGVVTVNANLGIGATSPLSKFEVRDDAAAVALSRFDSNQNADTTLVRYGNTSTGTGARMRIQMNNNFANTYLLMNGSGTTDSGAFGTSGLTVQNDGTGGIRLAASNASGAIKFFTAGTGSSNERVIIDSAGFVGIGEGTPLSSLHIQDDATAITSRFQTTQNLDVTTIYSENPNVGTAAANTIKLYNGTTDATLSLYGSNFTPSFGKAANGTSLKGNGAGGLSLLTSHASATLNFITANGTVATMTPAGKMGIGLNDPDGILHVRDTQYGTSAPSADADEIVVENFGNAGISILTPITGKGSIHFGDNADTDIGIISYDHVGDYMAFYTAAAERMRILQTGEVSIGSTTANGTLHIEDSTNAIGLGVYRDASFGTSSTVDMELGNSGTDEGKLRFRYTNSTTVSNQQAVVDFLPRNAADNGVKQGGRLTFTNDSDLSGTVELSAPNNSAVMITVALDGDDQVWAPTTTGQVGLGRTGKRWSSLWLSQGASSTGAINTLNSHASFSGDAWSGTTNISAGSGFNMLKFTADIDGTPDPVFRVQGDGATFADGAYSGAGADYADYFEWEDGNPDNEDRVGQSVVLTASGKIEIATEGDNPIGVISGRPSVAGNAASESWANKYLKDDYHRYILDDDGVKILNPDYDPDTEYTPRPDRVEWDAVGLVGRLPLNKGQATSVSWTKIKDISDTVEEWLVTGGITDDQIIVSPSSEYTLYDMPDVTETEETATAAKLEELSTLFYARLSEGFVWKKETFDVDERAQHNIGVEFMFQAQSIDDFPKDFSWRGYQNQEVAMDYHQFMDFAKASRTHVKKMRAAKALHEKSINRKRLVKSIRECDISKGWPKSAIESLPKKKKK